MTAVASGEYIPLNEEADLEDSDLIRRVEELWNEGKTLRDIGAAVGKSHATAREILRQRGYNTSRRTSDPDPEREARLIQLYTDPQNPRSIREAARAVRMQYITAESILRAAGVLRGKGPAASGSPKKQLVGFRADPEYLEWLNRRTRELGITRDELIRRAVQEKMERDG